MSPADWVIIAIVVVCFILALHRINRNHKSGKHCSCGGACAACESCNACCSECEVGNEDTNDDNYEK